MPSHSRPEQALDQALIQGSTVHTVGRLMIELPRTSASGLKLAAIIT